MGVAIMHCIMIIVVLLAPAAGVPSVSQGVQAFLQPCQSLSKLPRQVRVSARQQKRSKQCASGTQVTLWDDPQVMSGTFPDRLAQGLQHLAGASVKDSGIVTLDTVYTNLAPSTKELAKGIRSPRLLV